MSKDLLTKGFEGLGEGTAGQALVANAGAAGAVWAGTPAAYTQTYTTADRTIANPTAATLTVSDGAGTNDGTIGAITGDASVIAAVQELAAQINKLIADGLDLRQGLTAVVDDLQTYGFAT